MVKSCYKLQKKYVFPALLIIISIFVFNCTTMAISPHAQNEMIVSYNVVGEKQELGGAFAYNEWIVDKREEKVYIKTYPSASFSFFHNASYSWGKLGGIGGIELIGSSLSWTVPDASGYVLYLKPYAGFQYNGSVVTCRLNFSPLIAGVLFGDGEWTTGGDLSKFTIYQLTILLHNLQPAKHTYWGGVRSSVGAIGLVGGYEYSFSANSFLRAEYSYLMKPLFPILLTDDEFESIVGSVHYLTIGFFKRVK